MNVKKNYLFGKQFMPKIVKKKSLPEIRNLKLNHIQTRLELEYVSKYFAKKNTAQNHSCSVIKNFLDPFVLHICT